MFKSLLSNAKSHSKATFVENILPITPYFENILPILSYFLCNVIQAQLLPTNTFIKVLIMFQTWAIKMKFQWKARHQWSQRAKQVLYIAFKNWFSRAWCGRNWRFNRWFQDGHQSEVSKVAVGSLVDGLNVGWWFSYLLGCRFGRPKRKPGE